MKLQYYLITVSYKGGLFHGSQLQNKTPPIRTVESEIFDALIRLKISENPSKANFKRVSRTDSGVSAYLATFSLFLKIDDQQIQLFRNELPEDISLISLQRVCKSFDPLKYCTGRDYAYYIPETVFQPQTHQIGEIFTEQFSFSQQTTSEKFNFFTDFFAGKHHNFFNFAPFNAVPNHANTKEFSRKINSFQAEKVGDFYKISISGQGFFKHHIRRLIFAVIQTVNLHMSVYAFQSLFDWRVGLQEVQRAPSEFLVLENQRFDGYQTHVNLGQVILEFLKPEKFEQGKTFVGEFWKSMVWDCEQIKVDHELDYSYFYELQRRQKLLEEKQVIL